MMAPVAELIKEVKNDTIQDDLEGHDLERQVSNHPDNYFDNFRVQSRLEIEYEAALTDPRRI